MNQFWCIEDTKKIERVVIIFNYIDVKTIRLYFISCKHEMICMSLENYLILLSFLLYYLRFDKIHKLRVEKQNKRSFYLNWRG